MILQVLRVIHIVGGVIWVGGIAFMTFFLVPSVRAVGPSAGPLMGHLTNVGKFPNKMIIIGFITIAAGFWLYWHAMSGAPGWASSGPAKVYGMGAIFALSGWIMGMTLNVPTAKKLGALNARIAASGAPPTAEDKAQVEALQARLGKLSLIGITLLLLATIAMALARYVA
jgi:uncharacterized membrane protein